MRQLMTIFPHRLLPSGVAPLSEFARLGFFRPSISPEYLGPRQAEQRRTTVIRAVDGRPGDAGGELTSNIDHRETK